MQRREFIKLCAAAAAAGNAPGVSADARPRFYARATLVGPDGQPLRASRLPENRNLIFHYPYAATPCFLLNLGHPVSGLARLKTDDGRPYEWQGGVGAKRSIVAYSAICAHRLTYPTREISFISFRTEKTPGNRFANVIHCCSEHSQYDPAQGGRVLAGPAPQPLAAILLEHDPARDELAAVGTLGGEMFDAFFDKYAFRFSLEGQREPRAPVAGSAPVVALERYCRQQVKC
ncbi:MAG TPA: (2Fe-2S)-binding protein [Burkholderiales bacterium]|nr:(2Fe-2S)-binding protein [Burkholderiales bacterium]